jgi:hypothetical protein
VYFSEIDIKLNQGYSYYSLFKMMIEGILILEDDSLNISERMILKKEQYKALYNSMTKHKLGHVKLYGNTPIQISQEDLPILFFNDSDSSRKIATKNGISAFNRTRFLSFELYCDRLEALITKHKELEPYFQEIFFHCFIITLTQFELMAFEDNDKQVEYVKKLIVDFEKQQKGNASEQKKQDRKSKLIGQIGFEIENLSFDDQIKFYKELIGKSNRDVYTLHFLRDNLVNVLNSIKVASTLRNFMINLYDIIEFLNRRQQLLEEEDVDNQVGYRDFSDYKYRTSESYFRNLRITKSEV